MAMATDLFEKAVLVVAHPDDEVLWFSSILTKMEEIVVCFSDVVSRPDLTEGRRISLRSHPVEAVSCLGLTESEALNTADWRKPVLTEYGLKVSRSERSMAGFSARNYVENYKLLLEHLRPILKRFRNVFTHNPWGEYGHEEHVQVYRVLKELQNNMQYNLWFSNYCSNKSFNLMLAYVSGFDSEYITLNTDKILGNRLKNLYKKNNCWTWYDNYEWFNNESFMLAQELQNEVSAYGHIFPLNLIKIEFSAGHNCSSETQQTLLRRMFRKIRYSQ